MMNFPSSPSVGQTYPSPAVAGLPVYKWDGEKWKLGTKPSSAAPASSAPLMDGVAAPGTSINWPRGDHRHPSDTSRAPVASPTFTGTFNAQTYNGSGDMTVSGTISATQDQNLFGTASGAWNTITPADSNIVFYDYADGNWAGMGADNAGIFFVRTGGAGSNGVAAMIANNSGVCGFSGVAYAPTPSAGDNSTKAATTAFVVANQPIGGPYLPLTGGTLTGPLTVSYGHIMPYRNNATGVLYMSNGATADRYIYSDGTNYSLNVGSLYTAAGRIWGDGDWTRPMTGGRLAHAGDQTVHSATGLAEPYGGAAITGQNGMTNVPSNYYNTFRYRYNQLYVEGVWYTAGYA